MIARHSRGVCAVFVCALFAPSPPSTLQIKAHLGEAHELNTNLGAKPKPFDSKTDLIYKRALCNYL